MLNKKPFFSVVLPTLNRAEYLSFAIESVLNQTFEDLELIVSNNSSTDNTEQIVKSFSDKRIRYVKTDEILPMDESWEFAIDQAAGEYVTFIGDDDAHSSIYLESLKKVIDEHDAQIVSTRMADYHYQNSDGYNPESLTTPPFSNKLLVYDSQKLIKDIYINAGLCEGNPSGKYQIPQSINTAYHRSVFSKIKSSLGRICPKILAGDFYLAVTANNFAEKYYYLDAPLSFHGISPGSTTASITSQPKGIELKKSQPELAVFKKVPLSVYVPYNYVADALLAAKSDLGDDLSYLDLDWSGYFVNIFYNLHEMERIGYDMSGENAEFSAAVAAQTPDVQRKITAVTQNKKNILKNKMRIKFYNNFIYNFLRNVRGLTREKLVVVEGKNAGFNNIVECAKVVDYQFLDKYKNKN